MKKLLLLLSLGALFAGGAALAQETSGGRLVGDVTACRTITDDAQRLACFDAASGRLAEAAEARDIVVIDRQDVRETRRSLFGFPTPDIPAFANLEDEEDEFERISTTIQSVRPIANGRYRIVLEEGAIWETTESTYVFPRAGQTIDIREAALGSFFANISGQRAVRIRRVG